MSEYEPREPTLAEVVALRNRFAVGSAGYRSANEELARVLHETLVGNENYRSSGAPSRGEHQVVSVFPLDARLEITLTFKMWFSAPWIIIDADDELQRLILAVDDDPHTMQYDYIGLLVKEHMDRDVTPWRVLKGMDYVNDALGRAGVLDQVDYVVRVIDLTDYYNAVRRWHHVYLHVVAPRLKSADST